MSDRPRLSLSETNGNAVTAEQRLSKWPRWRDTSEVWKNWVEVAGLGIAGVWILIVFGLQSCPTREKQFSSETTFSWKDGPTRETCIAEFYVKITNISARSINIRRVDVRVWQYSLLAPTNGRPGYIDTEQVRPQHESGYAFLARFTGEHAPIVDEYSPNGATEHEFQWVFQRPPEPMWAVLEIQLYENISDKDSLWHVWDTERICSPEAPD